MTADPWTRSVRRALAVLVILIIGGALLGYQVISLERDRVWHDWRARLGLIADTRADLVLRWRAEQLRHLRGLAGNPSLQLYLVQLGSRRQAKAGGPEPAQLSYLRNLIRASALRGGYVQDDSTEEGIGANLGTTPSSGLMLLDAAMATVAATSGMPALSPETLARAREVMASGQARVGSIYLDNNDVPVVSLLMPVSALTGTGSGSIGVLVGVKSAARELFPLLRKIGTGPGSEETLLVQRDGDSLVYVSPTGAGGRALRRRLHFEPESLASAYAVEHPGGFAVLRDYAQTPVLVTSRALPGLPWTLVQKVGEKEALSEYQEHRDFLLVTLVLVLTLMAALLVAAWRHGSSLRAQLTSEELRRSTVAIQSQWKLLRTITDNIGEVLFVLDRQEYLTFANRALASLVGLDKPDFQGKTLASVLGPAPREQISALLEQCWSTGRAVTATEELELGGARGTYQLIALPLEPEGGEASKLLVVAHDVTELLSTQRKRGRLMSQLVSVLVRLIDLHDPHCVDHSVRTAEVAVAIGQALELDKGDLETLSLAAKLANLGKIFIPRELLTKPGDLTRAERQTMRDGEDLANETLAHLEFVGPVTEIIAQRRENMDGSGKPKGLRGEEIHIGARILAVANAYVAMTSSRAYREGMTVRETLDDLLRDSATRFDRRVVGALFYLAENRPDLLSPERLTALPDGIGEHAPLRD